MIVAVWFVWCGVMCGGLLGVLLFAFGCLLFGSLLFALLVWLAVCCWGVGGYCLGLGFFGFVWVLCRHIVLLGFGLFWR